VASFGAGGGKVGICPGPILKSAQAVAQWFSINHYYIMLAQKHDYIYRKI